jgi:hypothetical protein
MTAKLSSPGHATELGLADDARHVIGCQVTQRNEVSKRVSTTWRAWAVYARPCPRRAQVRALRRAEAPSSDPVAPLEDDDA